MSVSDEAFFQEVNGAVDHAYDKLEATAKLLKGDQMKEVARSGFDLDRVAADLLRWQRSFRLMMEKMYASEKVEASRSAKP